MTCAGCPSPALRTSTDDNGKTRWWRVPGRMIGRFMVGLPSGSDVEQGVVVEPEDDEVVVGGELQGEGRRPLNDSGRDRHGGRPPLRAPSDARRLGAPGP